MKRVRLESDADGVSVSVEMKNRGVAPFYYDWEVQLGFLDRDGNVSPVTVVEWRLSDIMPGDTGTMWSTYLSRHALPHDLDKVLLRVINPLSSGKSLRFSNGEQDQNLDGWLTLASF